MPIATLGQLLGCGSYADLLSAVAGGATESGEAGYFSVPASIRDALAGATGFEETAKSWASAEEPALSGWNDTNALVLLSELGELARTARLDGEELWYWWSQ